MRILFLSRAYPPVTGGIENHNYSLAKHLGHVASVTVVANKRGKKFLPLFLPYAFFKCLLAMRDHDAMLLGDGVLAPLGGLISFFYPRKKFACVLHGLDITFARKKSLLGLVYRFVNIPFLKLLDNFIMVGNRTLDVAEKVGIDRNRSFYIPNGTDAEALYRPTQRYELERALSRKLDGKQVILRVGRFVEHKGVEWFIRNVLPKLPENVLFVAAGGVVAKSNPGDKNALTQCQNAVGELHMENRVILIPNAPQEIIKILYNSVDLYVSPNIRVHGSMEGFGINAIEAAGCGRVVIAADLDGLKDAIIEGKNGYLIEPENADRFAQKIMDILRDGTLRAVFGQAAKEYTLKNYSWDGIAKRYLDILQDKRTS